MIHHIAIMDYCKCNIKLVDIDLPKDAQVEEIEAYLIEHYSYHPDACYWMVSIDRPIDVEYTRVLNGLPSV